MGTERHAASLMSSGHGAHARHAVPTATGHADMPCCDSDAGLVCAMGDCTSGVPAVIVPDWDIRGISEQHAEATDLLWLAPYPEPPGTLFRPPIC